MTLRYQLLGSAIIGIVAACSGKPDATSGSGGNAGGNTSTGTGGSTSTGNTSGSGIQVEVDSGTCQAKTCAELGWKCGSAIDDCGNVINCADEGLACGPSEVCVGGIDSPAVCTQGSTVSCDLCPSIPDCSAKPQLTRLTGRVVSPGKSDNNTANQVGVPNAVVYILRSNDEGALPAISSGIPTGGTSCDRCEDQDLGPVLIGTVTDASGNFVLEGNVPVGVEFVLVVKVGKFRRAVKHTLPAEAACQTTDLPSALPNNPTRLPRNMTDGLAVNIPRIAVTTGQLDAMECVLQKMGIANAEFGNPGANGNASERVHLYRGGSNTGDPPGRGARIDDDTPHDSTVYTSLSRLQQYDMVVADCEGQSWDDGGTQRTSSGANVREYVNRGGRMFASHLSFSWLHENGTQEYSAAMPFTTGLDPAATWSTNVDSQTDTGTGVVSLGRPNASPRIQNFADWMVSENVTTAPDYEFTILEPRSQTTGLGTASEEFVFRDGGNDRVQQFSFNTPYGAPAEAACGRVAYSGFHVSIGSTTNAIFPDHCDGNLTAQEKVLLYMLFDLGACVGVPEPPSCTPITCASVGAQCGAIADGCGNVLKCGECPADSVCGVDNKCSDIR